MANWSFKGEFQKHFARELGRSAGRLFIGLLLIGVIVAVRRVTS